MDEDLSQDGFAAYVGALVGVIGMRIGRNRCAIIASDC